jgi:hypothetical protein
VITFSLVLSILLLMVMRGVVLNTVAHLLKVALGEERKNIARKRSI